jgi:spore maturation protein CgeB
MKNILLIAPTSSTMCSPIRRAFEHHGFEVSLVDYRGNFVLNPENILHRFVKNLPPRLFVYFKRRAKRLITRQILKKAEKIKPDCVFVVKGPALYPDTLVSLRKICPLINYYPETMDQIDLIKKIAPYYDYFVNLDPYVVEMLKKEGYKNALYIPFSADLNENDRWIRPQKYLYNISFIGTYDRKFYSEREFILNEVKDFGLCLWGNEAWSDTSLRGYYRGRVKTEDIQNIYRNSKIVINADISREVLGTGVNLRPFEATAAGTMLLNRDDRKDIFNLFEDGKEFVSFSGAGDVRQKAEYYLNHEEERLKIAEAGFNRARNDHTYIKRIGEIIKITGI